MMLTEEEIFWSDSFSKRIEVKLDQLSLYINSLNKIIKSCKDKNVKAELLRIKLIFTDSITSNSVALRKFSQRGFVENFNAIKDVSNYLHKNKEKLLTNTNSIIKDLDLLINEIIEKKIKAGQKIVENLIILKIEIKNFGLGLGRTHLRLNANQLNNAISKEIDLSGDPNDPSSKRTYLNVISKMIDKVKPAKINFGSIYEENMNARRYFMLTKQILKYIDENQSIRFLIAECDYSLTVMTALYFSKLFGVDKKIDIFPSL